MTTKTEPKTTETATTEQPERFSQRLTLKPTARAIGMTGEERSRLASLRLVTERYRARNDRLERCLATSFRRVEGENKP